MEAAVANKASAIISFGVAGGLAPGLAPGSKLVARSIVTEDGDLYYGDPLWSKRLVVALGGATIADIAGIDAPVAGHADKHALHLKTGAHAADMESHIAARIAAAHKLPFAAFRVVADPGASATAARRPGGDDGRMARLPSARSLGSILARSASDPAVDADRGRCAAAFSDSYSAAESCLPELLGFHDFRELLLDVPAEDILSGTLQV